jgi:hypothetical protein
MHYGECYINHLFTFYLFSAGSESLLNKYQLIVASILGQAPEQKVKKENTIAR